MLRNVCQWKEVEALVNSSQLGVGLDRGYSGWGAVELGQTFYRSGSFFEN